MSWQKSKSWWIWEWGLESRTGGSHITLWRLWNNRSLRNTRKLTCQCFRDCWVVICAVLRLITQKCLTPVVPWTVDHLLPLSMDSPDSNTGTSCHFLLQGILPTQEMIPCLLHLLHWQGGFLSLAPPGKPGMQDFKHDLTGMRDACNCPMVSIFFSTTLLGN